MRTITKLTLVCLLLILQKTHAEEPTLKNGFQIGFQLSQNQNDFGFGLNITSPLLAHQSLGFRLKSNMMFYEHVDSGAYTWSPYTNVSVGIIGIGGHIANRIRLYGEGGFLLIFPSPAFSSETTNFGGYGNFGFEFFMTNSFNYFIEIGGIGSGATADKVAFSPIYSNGLSINVGFRITL